MLLFIACCLSRPFLFATTSYFLSLTYNYVHLYVPTHVCCAFNQPTNQPTNPSTTLGCLGDWPAFNEFYSRPIKRGQTKTADRDAVKLGRKRSAELVQALLPLMLRRTKQEQLANELPDKFDRIVFCALTPLQVRWSICSPVEFVISTVRDEKNGE